MSFTTDFSLSHTTGQTLKCAVVNRNGTLAQKDVALPEIATGIYAAVLTLADGQVGEIVAYSGSVGAGTDLSAVTPKGAASISGESGIADIFARLGAPAGASIAADLAEIEADVDALGATGGTGARTVTITVNDGSAPLQNAFVRIYLNASNNQVRQTNASGVVVFGTAADGTYNVAIGLDGYTFTPTTIVISADTSHTYSMTAVSINPSAPGETTGYLTCYDSSGAVQSGVVITVRARQPLPTDTGRAISGAAVNATSNGSGLVQFAGMQASVTYDVWRTDTSKSASVRISDTPSTTTALPSVVGTP